MEADRSEAVATLLLETEAAHGMYETQELNGVYDEAWARWYAGHAVDHGLGELLGHPVAADEVAAVLTSAFAEFEALDPKPGTWASYIGRRMVDDL